MIPKSVKARQGLVSLDHLVLSLCGALMLTSCKQDAAEARFADDYHCQPDNTEELSGGSYRVSGCGIEATYTCVREAGGSSGGEIVCIREEESPHTAVVVAAAPPRKGSVARLVDEASGARSVSAELPLVLKGAPGPLLRLRTKPGGDPNRVWVSVVGSTRQLAGESCKSLAVVVNGAAVAASDIKRVSVGAVEILQAPYAADTFAPLIQKNPTFGVKVCNSNFAVPEDELPSLQKFLAIRDELVLTAAPANSAFP